MRRRIPPVRLPRRRVAVLAVVTLAVAALQAVVSHQAYAADPLISQGKPVLASSEGGSGYVAKNAVDGTTSTRWASVAKADPQWLRVDLGATMHVSKVSLVWDLSCATSYQLQISANGTTFTTFYSTTTGKGATEDILANTSGRYVRMLGTVRCRASGGYSLQEFKVFGSAPAPSPSASPSVMPSPPPGLLSQGKPVLASSEGGSGYVATNAVDGRTSTRWASVSNVDPQWLRVDLGATMHVNKVSLVWDLSCATSYSIQVSGDGTTFSNVSTTTTGKGGTENITLDVNTRFVRMFGTKRCRPTAGYSLQEFQVFGATIPPPPVDPLVSQGKLTVASSDAGAPFGPASAVDGSTSTRWMTASGAADPQWIRVDLGREIRVSKVSLVWDTACARGYQVQSSDDANTFANVFLTTSGDGGVDDIPLAITTRYVRVFATARCAADGYALQEFKVYGTPAPARQLLSQGKPVTASNSASPDLGPANVVDGNVATRWDSGPGVDSQWVRVDLGARYALTSSTIVWDVACATTFRIQVSDDDITYSDTYATTFATGGTANIALNATGQFVRLWNSVPCNNSQFQFSVDEFKVFGTTIVPEPSTATITVGSQNGAFLADEYTGFSFGLAQLKDPALATGNLAQYMKTLGTGVVRFGGSDDENVFWTTTNETPPTWSDITLTPVELQRAQDLAVKSGWKVILGVNLQRGDVPRVADEARVAKQILGDHLLALELGNEPNYWTNYPPSQYYTDWEAFRAGINQAAPGVKLLGPSVGRVGAGDVYLNDFADRQQSNPDVGVLTSHFYPSCSRSASNGTISITTLLSTDWHNRERQRADLVAGLAARLHVPGMITESNSVSCAGVPGVSDVFASSLWGVDEMMSVADAGDAGLFLHGSTGTCGSPYYAPLCSLAKSDAAAGIMHATPVYYAELLTQRIGTGFFQPVSDDAPSVVRAYAVRNGSRLRLVLVNVSDPASHGAFPITVNLPAAYSHGDYFRLSAPALTSTSAVTMGGQSMREDGTFAGEAHTPMAVSGATLSTTLPAGSVTVLTLTP